MEITHNVIIGRYAASWADGSVIKTLGTALSHDIEKLVLSVDEFWKDTVNKAVFYPPEGDPVTVVLSNNTVQVPHEATQHAGSGTVVFVGVDGYQIVSTNLRYMVESHSYTGSDGQPPTPTEWEQFVKQT